MTGPDRPEALRFRTLAATLVGRSDLAARLSVGAVVAWTPLATLAPESRRAVERAELGDDLTLRVETWKADRIGWAPAPPQPALPLGRPAARGTQ